MAKTIKCIKHKNVYTSLGCVAAGGSTWAVAAGASSVRLRLPSFAEHPGQGRIKEVNM